MAVLMHEYEVNIGIEVHVQLKTNSKIFCDSPNGQTKEANTHICPVCVGYPGVLPVLNEKVLEYAVKAGLATNCTISKNSEFARKHYFYPDLPKNYQISQDDKPLCTEGHVDIRLENGNTKRIRIMRIHIEEDAGKNLHATRSNESYVDLNRAGTPLLEIVSHPDISSIYETKAYLKALRNIVVSLDICSGNMEEGAFRADTNVSVRLRGAQKLGTRCELKNINSFKFIGDAVEYEIARQIDLLENGKQVIQETRSWDTKEHKTLTLRSKEEAADYRYFTDPDLPLIQITDEYIKKIQNLMPELPNQKLERLSLQYGLTLYEAEILVDDALLCSYYEQAWAIRQSKHLINWVLRDVLALVHDKNQSPLELLITPKHCAQLVGLLDDGIINNRTAKEIFDKMATSGALPEIIVQQEGLQQVGSHEELETIIKDIVEKNPEQVAQYRSGKDKLFGFFVGQVMQKTQGKGNPHITQELLKKYLKSDK